MVFGALWLSFPAAAQVDSAYIVPFPQELSLGAYSYYQFTMLTHEINDREKVVYMPNSPVGLGLSVAYKGFSLSGGLGFNFMRDPKYGETSAFDLQYHYYGRKFIVDFFFQRYKGFYTDDDTQVITFFPDIRIIQYGLHGQYIFNNKKFSYRAAFDQSEQQRRSAGSFQVGGGFYFNQVAADSSLSMNGHTKLNNYHLSLSGGYVYNWIIKTRWHVLVGITLGIDLGTEDISMRKHIEVSPSVFPRVAFGYSGNSWSLGASFVMNRLYVSRDEGMNMIFDTGYAQLLFIKRIDVAPKFLHKIKFLN